jgi:hypothetical protein
LFDRRSLEWNGVHGEEGARVGLTAFFEVAQTGVKHFFHPAEFSAPQIAHIVEAAVDGVEAGIDVRHEKGCNNAHQRSVEEHRKPDREIELLVGHQE